jgi:GNAT superfamily N-acetyltransferase
MDALPGEDTLVASWQALAQLSPGAQVLRSGRHVAAVFPTWTPLNNAIVGGPSSAAAAAARALATIYGTAGVSLWAMWLRSSLLLLDTPAGVSSIEGLSRDTTTLVMTRPVTAGSSNASVVRTSIHTATLATEQPVDVVADPDCVPNLDGWVYVNEGAAVAGAWSYLNKTDIGLYAIGTAPTFRRRGIAAALVRHILADAHRRGARTASLQSTRMGEPLYQSLGFAPVARYEEWVPAVDGCTSARGSEPSARDATDTIRAE